MNAFELRRARIGELVDQMGSQKALSDAVQCAPNYISRIMTGSKNLGEDLARRWEVALGLPALWFDTATDLAAIQGSPGSSPEPASTRNWVDVQGALAMDKDGFCGREEIRELKGSVPWMGDGVVEAWQVYGDSVQKRYPDGWFIFVAADRAPEAGDDVMVELKDGRITLAEFTSERDGILSLRRHDDGSRRSLPMGAVAAVKTVVVMIHRSKFKPAT